MYTDLTTQNKSWLKRFSHGTRFKIALELLSPSSKDKILDYGTGDGFMLSMIQSANNRCMIVGYEPVHSMFEELKKNRHLSAKFINNMNNIPNITFDKWRIQPISATLSFKK